jgi:hypothetical protein
MKMNKLEWDELWEAMDAAPTTWIETTEGMYWAMLGVVPPQDMTNDAFLVGEPNNHNAKGEAVYACFKRAGDVVEARYMTQKEFDGLKEVRA